MVVLAGLASPMPAAPSYYVDYSSRVDPLLLRAFDESVLHPDADVDLSRARELGHRSYAYLSLVEVAADASYRDKFEAAGIPIVGKNEEWNSSLIDITHPAWKPFFLRLARDAAEKGFDGFFLDTVESIEYLARKDPARAAEFRSSAVDLIQTLKKDFPEKRIILNRGFTIWKTVKAQISGVMVESLFQTVDLKTHAFKAVTEADTESLLKHLREIKAEGLAPYVLDYVDPKDAALARKTAERIEQEGFRAFISTPELNGESLAPLRFLKRRVLILYGKESGDPQSRIIHPIDSITARVNQMPLEWLGFECDYHFIGDDLPHSLTTKYHAILLDQELTVPFEKESSLAGWLIIQKRAGVKVVIMGGFPIKQPENRQKLMADLGIEEQSAPALRNFRFEVQSPITGFETRLRLYTNDLPVMRAPERARLHISLAAEDEKDKPHRLDFVFTTEWGGVASYPYLTFSRPDDDLWFFDPFAFFEEALGLRGHWPAPDVSTREGKRVFFSHIDGDGFRHKSAVQSGKLSSEIILERIIKKYPLPISVSVIEAEMRGLIEDQKEDDPATLQKIAREMFATTNVHAGSHGWSHPFYWEKAGRLKGSYAARTLQLQSPHTVDDVDYSREIVLSSRYIQETLLPLGKKVELFQWSGDCRPTAAALKVGRQAGLEMINGGGTVISRRNPTVTRVAPKGIPWDGEFQVYAACENENVYRAVNDEGTLVFPGGFINVLDTFKRTDSPRRLSPVNIYFHFYSGDLPASLLALQRVFDWALSQPLHAISAAEYVRSVRDARETVVLERGSNEFVISNEGHCRTIRLPRTELKPDLHLSSHVTGYTFTTNALYVHTDGHPVVKLVLSAAPNPHIYLVSSSGPIKFRTLQEKGVSFHASDLRPITVEFGGLTAGAQVALEVNGTKSSVGVPHSGSIELKLPNSAVVNLKL